MLLVMIHFYFIFKECYSQYQQPDHDIVGQCDVRHIMMLPVNLSTTDLCIGLAVTLMITDVILNITNSWKIFNQFVTVRKLFANNYFEAVYIMYIKL